MSGRRARALVVGVTLLTATAACYSRQYGGEVDAAACEPTQGVLSAATRAEELTGEYRLVVIAAEGEHIGETATGVLRLQPNPEGLRELLDPAAGDAPRENVTVPLYGSAELDIEALGGAVPGDLSSEDPERPGALVVEQRAGGDAAPQIFIRLGSEGNDRSRQRFDGAYFAFVVTSVEGDTLRGSWTSGVEAAVAGGHFCAYRY